MPTRLLKLRSIITVFAPAARIAAGAVVPEATASVSPGFAGIGASWPAKSTQSGPESGRAAVGKSNVRAGAEDDKRAQRNDELLHKPPRRE